MTDEYRDILGGNIRVFSNGDIVNISTNRKIGYKNQQGYVVVEVKEKTYKAHRLVAHAFLGLDLLSELTVDHLNGVKDDNRVSNLEVVTIEENVRRARTIYEDSLEKIEEAVLRHKSWTKAARELGYSDYTALQYRYKVLSGKSPKDLSVAMGRRHNQDSIKYLRELSLAELLSKIAEFKTQRALAENLGTTQQQVSKILNEKRREHNERL